MGRKDNFNMGHGWSFPVNPEEVVKRTLEGGYTVNLNTGEEPKTGTMVSIPGHEVPVPIDKFSDKDVKDFSNSERMNILKKPEMHMGTWRSADDKTIGDAAYLDISKRFEDNPSGASEARTAAMQGDQWALYNIDRKMFEKNITKPEVVEGIKEDKKIQITPESIKEYPESTNPVGTEVAYGWKTEPETISRGRGRRKLNIPAGQLTFIELGEKANYD
jgi:hypothetical protein